jgi:putative endonuclease
MTRRRAQKFGFIAEWGALLFLTIKGYRLLARNFRSRRGEIDLIMMRGSVLIFIEVKFRQAHHRLDYAITPQQWRRIYAAASDFVAQRPELANLVWRFDCVLCSPVPRHQKDVWRIYDGMP